MPKREHVLVALTACLLVSGQTAAARDVYSGAIACTRAANSFWTIAERVVWRDLCEGREAGHDNSRTPSASIRGEFLSEIISNSALLAKLPAAGLQVVGAHIIGGIRAQGGELRVPVWIRNSQIDGGVDLRDMHAMKTVSLNDTSVGGTVNLYGSRIDADLELNGGNYGAVKLSQVEIGGQLNLVDSVVTGPVFLFDSRVSHSVFLNRSQFEQDVSITNSIVGGSVIVLGAALNQLSIGQSRIAGALRIGCQPQASPEYSWRRAFGGLGSHEWNHLYLGEQDTEWPSDGALILQGTEVQWVDISDDGWAPHIDLTGFKYAGFVDAATELGAHCRSVRLFEANWTKRPSVELQRLLLRQDDERFSLQPYTQLASVLEVQGYSVPAKDIRFAGQERARQLSSGVEFIWRSMQGAITGYGQWPHRALYWALAFVGLGALVFRTSKEAVAEKMPYGLAYSFDLLLPVIKLREAHYKIDLTGWRRHYFYLHKIVGWILAGFIIASLPNVFG